MIFLLPLLGGAAIGIVGFSKILEPALHHYPFQTNLFFVGLIAGSLPLLWKLANKEKFKGTYLIPLVLAAAVIVLFAVIRKPLDLETIQQTQAAASESSAPSTVAAPNGVLDYLYLFIVGTIASAAMVVPGISGSFMMVLLGTYNRVLSAISGLTSSQTIGVSVLTLVPTGLGMILGIVLISKALDFLLKKYYSYTYYAILGLVGGSMFTILYTPKTYHLSGTGEPVTFNALGIAIAAVVFVLGAVAAFYLGKEKKNKES